LSQRDLNLKKKKHTNFYTLAPLPFRAKEQRLYYDVHYLLSHVCVGGLVIVHLCLVCFVFLCYFLYSLVYVYFFLFVLSVVP
jgi:hypothetical protein